MRIHFKKVKYKNILSTGNTFTTIELDSSPTTLITGSNGSGKSTLLDAIVFGLYGKPFRKVNKAQLINSINQKGLLVEIYFTVGGNNYMVRRGMKPNVFDIYKDGELINQDAAKRDYQADFESNIIGINYKSFNQIVVLGSATYVPFMELPAQQRREIIEDLLDIQVFSTMGVLAKDQIAENKQLISENAYKSEGVENSIKLVEENNDAIRKIKETEVEKIREKMKVYIEGIETKKSDIESVEQEIQDFYQTIADKKEVKSKFDKANILRSDMERSRSNFIKELSFYHDNDNCPTCKQGIDHDFKNNVVEEKSKRRDEIESGLRDIAEHIKTYQERIDAISKVEDEIQEKNFKVSEIKAEIRSSKNALLGLKSELESAEREVEEVDTTKLQKLVQTLEDLKSKRVELLDEREVLGIVSTILKDGGIKARIISQYIPVMNKLINKYLAAFDLFVDFQLDENFNEVIKSRFRDTFSYASFSEGEKLRITLAIMLAWRSVAKLRNSVSTNLLILDETLDGALDGVGIENLIETLHGLNSDDNIFVISHRGDQFAEKFDTAIRFDKVKNFSEIAA
jgi:DNA repair exonuclease SbcCD ATPase subunit